MRGGIVGYEEFIAWEPGRRMAFRFNEASMDTIKRFAEDYLKPFVEDCADHDTYCRRIGGEETRRRLASWADGTEAWMALYRDEVPA